MEFIDIGSLMQESRAEEGYFAEDAGGAMTTYHGGPSVVPQAPVSFFPSHHHHPQDQPPPPPPPPVQDPVRPSEVTSSCSSSQLAADPENWEWPHTEWTADFQAQRGQGAYEHAGGGGGGDAAGRRRPTAEQHGDYAAAASPASTDVTTVTSMTPSPVPSTSGVPDLRIMDPPHMDYTKFYAEEGMALAEQTLNSLVKDEIRTKIQKKRRMSGLSDLKVDWDNPDAPCELTEGDEYRRERRKDSNRRAARKCREKKKKAADNVSVEFQKLAEENTCLRKQVEDLDNRKNELEAFLKAHLSQCPLAKFDKAEEDEDLLGIIDETINEGHMCYV